MKYKVELKDRSHYIIGLKEEYGGGPDTMLVYHYSYPESETPDVDTRMKNADMMLGALYDIFQCHDGIKKGDTFETEFGEFACEGVSVVPLFPMPQRDTHKDFTDSSIEAFTQHED
jgi:hypothetical protein